jgi:hypothetical protein
VKRILVRLLWELEPKVFEIALADGLSYWGGNHFGWRLIWLEKAGRALSKLYIRICRTTEEKHGKVSQGIRVVHRLLVEPNWLSFEGQSRLTCWTSINLGYQDYLSQPLVGTSVFKVAGIRGSPHQINLCRISQSVLWRSRRRMESPNPREFASYQRTKVP